MSGTASRFQTRFGYGPELRAGQYPVQPAAAPLAPAAPSYAPPALAPPAPAPAAPAAPTAPPVAPVAPPVSAGSNAADLFWPQTDGVSAGDRGFDGYGVPEPGTLGQWGSGLGMLAGLATGIPGLGTAIGAVGTALDVSGRNQQLADLSIPDRVDYPSAILSGMTLNALGRSPQDQFDAIWGQVAPDPASLTAENTAFPDNPFGPAPNTGNLTTPTPDMTPNLNFDFSNVSYTGGGYPPTPEQVAQQEGRGGYGYGTTGTMPGDFSAANEQGRNPNFMSENIDANPTTPASPGVPSGFPAANDLPGSPYGFDSGGSGYGAADPGGYGANADNGMGAGFGYQAGGYTGAGPDQQVQPWQPAGTVHEGEIIIPADQVQRYGVPALMDLAEGNPQSILAQLTGVELDLSGGGNYARRGGVRAGGGDGSATLTLPGGLDLTAGGSRVDARGPGWSQRQSRLEGLGAGVTLPSGDRLSVDWHDRLYAQPDALPGGDPQWSSERAPSRGVRLGWRREF